MATNETLLQLKDIDKRFGGVHALDNVSFDIYPGEVHAIVGENGAGKSTLMKILAGSYRPDQGEIRMRGEKVEFHNPRDSHAAGINIIYQEFYKFPALTVVANIFAAREETHLGLLNERADAETGPRRVRPHGCRDRSRRNGKKPVCRGATAC